MENNRFEDSFKNAFSEAELSPSAAVWTNVELVLEKASGGNMKRNLLLFQLLAAASIAFAFGIGALYYLENQSVGSQQPASESISKLDTQKTDLPKNADGSHVTNEQLGNTDVEETLNQKVAEIKAGEDNGHSSVSSAVDNQTLNQSSQIIQKEYKINKADLLSFTKTKRPELVLPEAEEAVKPNPEMLLQAQLKDIEKKYRDEDKNNTVNSGEKTWASVGFGAGSYKPNRQVLDRGSVSSGSTSGESYSLALNVASKISKRVIVQGGIAYLTQNADFTSTSSNGSAASLSEYYRPLAFESPGNTSNGGVGNAYQVNSSLQFISIPVQAGYLLVDRAFGVQLNGGVSTDLFISNTLTPQTGDYQKVTQAAGKESPYRTINFSGLLGTEFSYKIADQYRISLNPGLRYSLNSIYKEGVAAEITPVTFDVSLRFRYIFK